MAFDGQIRDAHRGSSMRLGRGVEPARGDVGRHGRPAQAKRLSQGDEITQPTAATSRPICRYRGFSETGVRESSLAAGLIMYEGRPAVVAGGGTPAVAALRRSRTWPTGSRDPSRCPISSLRYRTCEPDLSPGRSGGERATSKQIFCSRCRIVSGPFVVWQKKGNASSGRWSELVLGSLPSITCRYKEPEPGGVP